MPYGTAFIDSITSSSTLSVTGNITGATNLATSGNYTITTGQGVSYPLFSSTPVATTSGATITLATGLPSWIKRITVVLSSVSLTTANSPRIQLGYGTTPTWQTTGYYSAADNFTTNSGPTNPATDSFVIGSTVAATDSWAVNYVICNLPGTNIWVGSVTGAGTAGTNTVQLGGGVVTLTDTLTAVRLTTTGGTYDAGSAFVLYE